MKSIRPIAASLIFIILLISCSNRDQASIYKPGRSWTYHVEIRDSMSTIIDTFSLNMTSRESSVLEGIIRPITVCYEYKNAGHSPETECTGVVDNNEEIYIHPPRMNSLEFTEVLPFPRISKPMGMGFTSSIELNIQKASYWNKKKNATENLAGKTIQQELQATDFDTTRIVVGTENLLCSKISGRNLNYLDELGQFDVSYFFNEKYGCVKWIYHTPWKETATILMIQANY